MSANSYLISKGIMVLSVHYLRGLAALVVVCFHYRHYLNESFPVVNIGDILFSNGAFGVDLFFIISGFIICYSTRRTERFRTLGFVLKRGFRIYPLLFFSLFLFILFFDIQDHSLLSSFIPLHADYEARGPTYGFHLHSPVWTLTYELAFYLLFALTLMFTQRHRLVLAIGGIVTVFLGLQLLMHDSISLNTEQKISTALPDWSTPLMAIFSSPMVLEFALGIILYAIYRHLPSLQVRHRLWLGHCSLVVAALSALGLYLPFFEGHGPVNWGLPAFTLLLSLLIYEQQKGLPEIKTLKLLGNISFSLYLMHMIVIKLMRKYEIAQNRYGLIVFVSALLMSIAISYGTFVLIEQKAARLCRNLLGTLHKIPSPRTLFQGS